MGTSLLSWGFFWGFFYAALLALGEGILRRQTAWPFRWALWPYRPPSAPTQPGIFHASVVLGHWRPWALMQCSAYRLCRAAAHFRNGVDDWAGALGIGPNGAFCGACAGAERGY